jgi:hypothetical protein
VVESKDASWVLELADAPGRQCTRLIRLRSKPSFAASTLWRLALVPGDDWEADSAAVTNGSLKASRKMNRSFRLLRNFPFLWGPVCKRTGVMRED